MSLDVDSVSQSFIHLANPVVIQKVADYVGTLGRAMISVLLDLPGFWELRL